MVMGRLGIALALAQRVQDGMPAAGGPGVPGQSRFPLHAGAPERTTNKAKFTMVDASIANTRLTLLGRLQSAPEDAQAWSEFVESYGGKIYGWCRAWDMQEADAQDVTQEVFAKLSVRMREFQYDPRGSFGAWLKTVTHHAWQDYAARQRRPGRGNGGDAAADRLAAIEAREDLERRLDDTFDQELLAEAAALVRLRVEPRTWNAFYLLAVEGQSGAEVAEQLEMKVATVFVARSKVQRMLREEVARLERREPHRRIGMRNLNAA
jgi:RNA polymerase sigma-70 factor (ECF subfamily)